MGIYEVDLGRGRDDPDSWSPHVPLDKRALLDSERVKEIPAGGVIQRVLASESVVNLLSTHEFVSSERERGNHIHMLTPSMMPDGRTAREIFEVTHVSGPLVIARSLQYPKDYIILAATRESSTQERQIHYLIDRFTFRQPSKER